MANKKRRPRPHRRSADRTKAALATAAPPRESARDDARRLRREEARKQRELIRRRAVRRRYYRRGVWALVAAVAVGGVVLLATGTKHGAALTPEERALLAQAPQAEQAAGCGGVEKAGAYPGGVDQGHIGTTVPTAPPLSSYPSRPPASGPHDPSPIGAGVYSDPPPVYGVIHSLEHGAAVIWYTPTSSQAEVSKLTDFFLDPAHRDHVIVAPYNFPQQGGAGSLPAGQDMALVSWHHVELCRDVSLPAAFDFVAHYRFPTPKGEGYKGDAPEAGAPI